MQITNVNINITLNKPIKFFWGKVSLTVACEPEKCTVFGVLKVVTL
jgi:hypothetical protein